MDPEHYNEPLPVYREFAMKDTGKPPAGSRFTCIGSMGLWRRSPSGDNAQVMIEK